MNDASHECDGENGQNKKMKQRIIARVMGEALLRYLSHGRILLLEEASSHVHGEARIVNARQASEIVCDSFVRKRENSLIPS
jgi:hypothetical protein